MESLPTFELFPDPLRERVFKKSKKPCGFCRKARGWLYDMVIYAPDEVGEMPCCPWCIQDGTAAARGALFNDTDTKLSKEGRRRMKAADIELVTKRTPGYHTWQGNHWLMCCGRACIYLGAADAKDLKGRWAGAVPSMFDGAAPSDPEVTAILAAIERGGSPAAYVFKCQTCDGLKGYSDCD